MAEELVVDITSAGTVKVEAKGFSGNACAQASEHIELVLGGLQKQTKKPEFYSPPVSTQQGVKRSL